MGFTTRNLNCSDRELRSTRPRLLSRTSQSADQMLGLDRESMLTIVGMMRSASFNAE